jgi:hypothetical protein
MNDLKLYECLEIERQVNELAEQNEGVIPDEQLQQLILAQTTSLAKIENLCKWFKTAEGFFDLCDKEIDRIKALKEAGQRRVDAAKKFLTPYVQEKGKINAGTFELSVRKSEAVVVSDLFNNDKYMVTKTTFAPDKKKIKEALKAGQELGGAHIETRFNLQVK